MESNLIDGFREKRDKLATRSKWAIGLAAVFVLAPVSYLVAYALLGAAAATAAGIVLIAVWLAGVNAIPVLAMRFANWKLRALKAEAERSPIETLQNQQRELEDELAKTAEAITAFDGEVEAFRQSLQTELDKGYEEAARAGLPTLQQMERLLEFRRAKWARTRDALAVRAKKVSLAESKYRVALAARKVTAASGEIGSNVMDKILEDIAFTAVDRTVGTSLAELRTAVMTESIPEGEVQALPNGDAMDLRKLLTPHASVLVERLS